MTQYTAEEIQEQFKKLPREVQQAVTSVEVNKKVEAIAKKHGLLIDQIGELVDEVGLTMIGLNKSRDFVNNVIARCSIRKAEAETIAEEVNGEVFGSIRKYLQEMENTADSGYSSSESENMRMEQAGKDISALESAGQFEVIKDDVETKKDQPAGIVTMKTATEANTGKVESKSEIIETIEGEAEGGYPDMLLESGNTKGAQTGNSAVSDKKPTDPVAAHLLNNTVATNEEKIVRPTPAATNNAPTDNGAKSDLYREQV